MACALTQDYNLDCRKNYGGVKKNYVIEIENISTITLTANVVTAITKVATKVFRSYNLVAFTAGNEEDYTSDRATGTNAVKQVVKFPINKMTTAVKRELLLLGQNRTCWISTDNNGVNWLYGYEFGLIMTTAKGMTGVALKDRNGFDIAFEGDEKDFAYEVDSATMATLLS